MKKASYAKEKPEIVQPACLLAGRQVRKGRFYARVEGGSGGNSARPTNFGRNMFKFFRTHTASWKMRHFALSLASIHQNHLCLLWQKLPKRLAFQLRS